MEEATMQDATCALGATAILTPPQRAESIWSFTIMDAWHLGDMGHEFSL